jgi:exodeoxyribonuclease VII small subunit
VATPADPVPTPADDLAYADAMAELDAILAELERDAVDVDHLAQRVERAAELIRSCRARIADTRLAVERVVADLDRPSEPVEPPG